MSLYLVCGEQGAGKTLYVVRHAIRTVSSSRPAAKIYANLHIDHPNAVYASLEEMSAPDAPPGIYIWDEAARLIESRRSQSLPMSRLQSTTEERKHGRDVWMTAQMVSQVDVRVRRMCKFVKVLRPLLVVPRRYSKTTDEIVRREHPRLVIVSTWKGSQADKLKPDTRLSRAVLPWGRLSKYVHLYDTTASIGVAAHLAGRDFYLDKQGDDDAVSTRNARSRRVPRAVAGEEPPADSSPGPRPRSAARRPPAVRGVPGRP